jgi:hypothetical protein
VGEAVEGLARVQPGAVEEEQQGDRGDDHPVHDIGEHAFRGKQRRHDDGQHDRDDETVDRRLREQGSRGECH